ncbi:unnamed protein product, partial [Callosobruchus maculatus]
MVCFSMAHSKPSSSKSTEAYRVFHDEWENKYCFIESKAPKKKKSFSDGEIVKEALTIFAQNCDDKHVKAKA